MQHYAAHAIFYVKFKEDVQRAFPVWENVYLIHAESDAEALQMAKGIAREDEAANREMYLDEKPALYIFKGIRKLILMTDLLGRPLADIQHGQELTYSQFEAESEEDVTRLATGKDVKVSHVE